MAPLIPIPKLEVLSWRDAEKEFELAKIYVKPLAHLRNTNQGRNE